MQKKVIALAVAGALGAPALAYAQASTVQLYGKVNVEYAYIDEGGTRNTYDRVLNPGSSAIGFKGEEKLGGGLSAWFQCESTFDATGPGDTLCRRNSAVGIKGGFGNIFLGNWDTPYKQASGVAYRPFDTPGYLGVASILHNEITGNAANSTVTTLTTNVVVAATGATVVVGTTIATTASAGNATSFHRRQNNQIQYQTPVWQGFQAMFAWSAKNETAGTVAGAAEPRIWSLGATYRAGPFYIGAGYERHEEFRAVAGAPAGVFGDDTGWHINAAYTFAGVFRLGGIFERVKYETGAAGNPGAETERDAWGIYGEWKIQGPHVLRAGFTKADDSEGGGGAVNSIGSSTPGALVTPQGSTVAIPAGNNGAKQWSIEYAYQFSKRTELGVGYTKLDNDSAGLYRLNGTTRSTGQETDAFGVTLRHSF